MTVPSFQNWFLPILKRVADGVVHTTQELYEELAEDMELTGEDRAEMLPSGKQLLFKNRIGWARTYLQKAGLLDSPKRGEVLITDRGREVLANQPDPLNVKYLKKYPEFVTFHTHVPVKDADDAEDDNPEDDKSPEETLEQAYDQMKRGVTQELLIKVKEGSPSFFEQLVVDLLVTMGYGGTTQDAAQAVGGSGDGGIDGLIKQDALGLDVVYIQAKRWENSVQRPEVQKFSGSLDGVGASRGIMITTSTFTSGAKEYVKQINKNIVLVEGESLAELMFDHGLGVNPASSYVVKAIASDYFNDE
jgi:restriction system protein